MLMKDKYEFLSNFYSDPKYPIQLHLNGKPYIFRNGEAAFQCQKNLDYASEFTLLTGNQAKQYGKKIPLKMTLEQWNNNDRYYAMAYVLWNKFQHEELMEKLKAVTEPIVEDNYWNDTFWGVCTNKTHDHEGKNVLGQMLTCLKENGNKKQGLQALMDLCRELKDKYRV